MKYYNFIYMIIMVSRLAHSLRCPYTHGLNYFKVIRFSSRITNSPTFSKKEFNQIDYIKSEIQSKNLDWPTFKSNVLGKRGNLNEKNFEGVLLKILTNEGNYDAALSFANHLKASSNSLSLGATNSLLHLYYCLSDTKKLSKEETDFILDTYKILHEKYKVLDYFTCERLIQALCVIDQWEKALKVLEDIYQSAVPSHKAYSMIIGTLFKNNKRKKALELINRSVEDKRALQYFAFEQWINYILRKYKSKDIILKYLDEIYLHISKSYAVVDEKTAIKLKETFESLGWDAGFARIRKSNGQCSRCKETLDCLQLTTEEFSLLQQNIKDNLIVGSDLFLKTSPEELNRFLNFVQKTAPYDIVIDCLNVAYTLNKSTVGDKLGMLCKVVDHFKEKNKKILLLGRKHMLRWGKGNIDRLKYDTQCFFTDDLSQDDPYFITAAILSGPHTDIVSKDLLRGHQFLLKDKQLDYIFRKWQWQHQWMAFAHGNRELKIQGPLTFTPCAQKNHGAWHLPYERETTQESSQIINDGIPDLFSWLCITPKKSE